MDYARILDPQGMFSIPVHTTENQVLVSARGYLPAQAQFDPNAVNSSQEPIVIELTPGNLTIDGFVRNGEGQAVAGATVWAGNGSRASRLQPRDSSLTGADGAFHLEAVPEDTVEVVASHPDYAVGVAPVQPKPDVPATVTVVLPAGGDLEIFAHLGGQPLQGVQVSVAPGVAELGITDPDGLHHLTNLPAGEYEIRAHYLVPGEAEQNRRTLEQVAIIEPDFVTNVDFDFSQIEQTDDRD